MIFLGGGGGGEGTLPVSACIDLCEKKRACYPKQQQYNATDLNKNFEEKSYCTCTLGESTACVRKCSCVYIL